MRGEAARQRLVPLAMVRSFGKLREKVCFVSEGEKVNRVGESVELAREK